MKLPCDSINVRNNISMSVDVVALVCVCIFSVYIFVIHLVLLAGCSRGTSGSEFKQQQKFFRTIWWESFLSLFRQGSVFSSNTDRKVNFIGASSRWRCCLRCQWLAHCSSSMLPQNNVPISRALQKCQGKFSAYIILFMTHFLLYCPDMQLSR